MGVVDNSGLTPLHYASKEGDIETVKLLLSKGANIEAADKNGWTSFLSAMDKGHIPMMEMLIEKGANVNRSWKNITPLFVALYFLDKEIPNFLIKHGARLSWIEMLFCPRFSVEHYFKPFLQRTGEHVSNYIFSPDAVQLISDRDISMLNEVPTSSFVAHEEARRADTSQHTSQPFLSV